VRLRSEVSGETSDLEQPLSVGAVLGA